MKNWFIIALLSGCIANPLSNPTEMDAGTDPPTDLGESVPGLCAEGSCLFVASVLDAPTPVDGKSWGSNIDGLVSLAGDPDGCGKVDFEHPVTGEQGVDNGFSSLLPLLNLQAENGLQDAFVTEINRGALSMVIGLDGIDAADDEDAKLTIYRGLVPEGETLEVDSGFIIGGQTFDLENSNLTPIEVPAVVRDSVVVATLPSLTIPVGIRGGMLDVVMQGPKITATIDGDKLIEGEIAGALVVEQLTDGLSPFIGDTIAPAQLELLLTNAADIQFEGECSRLSLAFTFEAVEAVQGEIL